jgi:F-type H+-transporting ATPase subunit b
VTFDWSTFVLEIINFLILVWLLKRFLYKPVLEMVERRRASVEKTLGDAEAARDEARRLQQGYEARDAQWQQELAQRRQALDEKLQAEREKRMQALASELEAERERQRTREQRERAAHEQVLQARAAGQATRFAARLLQRLGGPPLQSRILDLLVEDLAALPDDRVQDLREAADTAGQTLVTSATALPPAGRQRLEKALAAQLEHLPPPTYVESADLVSGIRIGIGAWELDASLAGELHAFAESAHHD